MSGERLLIGVDAGGSHTLAIVADGAMHELARAQGVAGAIGDGGVEPAADAITQVVRQALGVAERTDGRDEPREVPGSTGTRQAPAKPSVSSVPSVLVVAAAGAGREPDRRSLEDTLASRGLAGRVKVVTDAEAALESVFPDMPGIVLIAGTGSIAWGRDAAGAVHRAGGFGWRMGDEGSGYALGRAALGAIGQAEDGRGPPTALTTAILDALAISGLDQLVRWAASADRRSVAALAVPVCQVARAGDALARMLVEQAVDQLAAHVEALHARIGDSSGGAVPLALGGGLLRPESPVRVRLLARLGEIEPPPVKTADPVMGALRLSAREVAVA